MAEINTAAAGTPPGVRRSKKLSTRVDLTPMVDLGFLLITFFIFTTTMSEPGAVKLIMPDDTKPVDVDQKLGESNALTLMPIENHAVFYYHGSQESAMKSGAFGITSFDLKTGIGQVIRDKQAAMDRVTPGSRKELMLLIKPAAGSHYQDFVNALDEVAINQVPRHALLDITPEEVRMIEAQRLPR